MKKNTGSWTSGRSMLLDELDVGRVVELAGKRRDGAREADVGGGEGGPCGAVGDDIHLQRLAFRVAAWRAAQRFRCKCAAGRAQQGGNYAERHHHE